jgi:hypothetical protein
VAVLGSLAAGGLGLVSTGAFSTVEASRTATVETAGDADALLGITPGASTGNPDDTDYPRYLTGNGENGTIGVDITNPSVNDNAVTEIDQLLEVTNNGTEKVTVGFVAEYAANNGDFRSGRDPGNRVLPYGYTYATNDAEDVALVMWASPKESRMDDTYAEVRPELVPTTGFDDSSDGLVNVASSKGEIVDTIDGGTDRNGRKIDPGESVNIGLVIDTRDDTINQNGGIPDALDKNINLVAEITENIDPVSDSN